MRYVAFTLVALYSLFSLGTIHAKGLEALPVTVTGLVTIDGHLGRSGAQVKASHEATTCAATTFDGSHYSLKLVSTSTACWTPGNRLSFTVDGRAAYETLTSPATTGITITLDLTVGQAPPAAIDHPAYALTSAASVPPTGSSDSRDTQSPAAAPSTTVTPDPASNPATVDATDAPASSNSELMAVPAVLTQQRPSGAAAPTGHLLQGSGAGVADLDTFVTDSGRVHVCFIISGVSQTGLQGPGFQFQVAPVGTAPVYTSQMYGASNCETKQLGPPGQYYLSVFANGWTNWTVIVDPG